jgi:hypothetical protein
MNDDSNNTTIIYGRNYPSLTLPGQLQQQLFSDDIYAAVILEEAGKLYNDLTTKLTNDVMAAAAAIRASSLPSPLSSSNKSQKLNYENDTYQTEETRCNNNQPEIYSNDQEQPN